jgi:hypothetical protein
MRGEIAKLCLQGTPSPSSGTHSRGRLARNDDATTELSWLFEN